MAEDQNRCWPGYEPVPGKKPNSQGSCRPKADSKSTPSEKAFKAKRKKQLDRWQEKTGGQRQAAQHLHGPDNEPSSQKGAAAPKKASSKRATKKTAAKSTGGKAPSKQAATRSATAKKRGAKKTARTTRSKRAA